MLSLTSTSYKVGRDGDIRHTGEVAPQIVLASSSPRRRDLLSQLGLKFDVAIPSVDEALKIGEEADVYVQRLSVSKAFAAEGDAILAADTCVVLDGEVFGKPDDLEKAESMLRSLSGNIHQVMTGVTVKSFDRVFTKLVTTEVEFAPMTEELIEWYLDRGESLDKAGGYAIQGAATAFVKRINGSHSNVIGLPMVETVELLRLAGVELTATNKSVFL